jgi:chromate transporter
MTSGAGASQVPDSRPLAIFAIFTRLGLTSFGGPIAHLGYLREEFVVRRRWLGDGAWADLVALCQFLPGPASSQAGFALGAMRGGLPGGLAAWLGFTWPSALALTLFAFGTGSIEGAFAQGILHGLMLVAVAVIAQAVFGMARTMCPDPQRAAIAGLAIVIVTAAGGAFGQIAAIVFGGIAGLALARMMLPAAPGNDPVEPLSPPISRTAGAVLIALVPMLLVLLWLAEAGDVGGHGLALFSAFYRAGALVFGGGHVVLPLLEESVVTPGWVTPDTFLSGYGAAQAVPGPLFTFAAFLGAAGNAAPNGWPGAAIALIAIFLPGLMLVLGALPYWDALRRVASARAAIAGINAAVVGILAAALYDPVWTAAVHTPADFAVAAAAFILLLSWRVQPWIVVVVTAVVAAFLSITL